MHNYKYAPALLTHRKIEGVSDYSSGCYLKCFLLENILK